MCDFVGPRMYGGHVDAGRCPPLVGCGLCGLEGLAAWHTVPKSGGIGTAAATVEGPSAGQLSGPHRRRCSHVQ